MPIAAGDTFIPEKYDHHLWVVLSDPMVDPEKVVLVNFTTHTVDEEQHCVLKKGDHPFIKHKTVVRYRDAKLVRASDLEVLLLKGN